MKMTFLSFISEFINLHFRNIFPSIIDKENLCL